MIEPTYTCSLCWRSVTVTPDGRGFPPDIARRKLVKICNANQCPSDPFYMAGVAEIQVRVMGQERGR